MIQKKMTVNATDDSYDKARQSMAQAEEETRSRGAIVIKHGGRYQGTKKESERARVILTRRCGYAQEETDPRRSWKNTQPVVYHATPPPPFTVCLRSVNVLVI